MNLSRGRHGADSQSGERFGAAEQRRLDNNLEQANWEDGKAVKYGRLDVFFFFFFRKVGTVGGLEQAN